MRDNEITWIYINKTGKEVVINETELIYLIKNKLIPENTKFKTAGSSAWRTLEYSDELLDQLNSENKVRPWVRYLARMFDLYSFSLIGGFAIAVISPQIIAKQNELVLGMLLTFIWIFVEALLLSMFQTTPGKWFFKTKISLASGKPINFSQALTRSIKVWWRGFGVVFPISLFTMAAAYGRLTRSGTTSWDQDDGFIISHEKIGALRVFIATLLIITFFFVLMIADKMEKQQNPFDQFDNTSQELPSAEEYLASPPLKPFTGQLDQQTQ